MELSAAAHRHALKVSKLTEPALAKPICSTRGHVKHFANAGLPHAPTLLHLVLAPDEYVDPLLRRLAQARAELGHALREWLAAAPVNEDADLGEVHKEGIAASLDLARALLEGKFEEAETVQLERIERVSLRNLTAARAVHAVAGQLLRGRPKESA